MKRIISLLFAAVVANVFVENVCAQTLINGVPWIDVRDSVVNAHGVGVIHDGGRYYLFGEAKTDSANVFNGFSCYSSENLVVIEVTGLKSNWSDKKRSDYGTRGTFVRIGEVGVLSFVK